LKLGIIGSRYYNNRDKIVDFILKCKNRYGENFQIVSGGCPIGADKHVKYAAIKLGIRYIEFAPKHQTWNKFCYHQKFYYGKKYDRRNFWERNRELVDYSDRIVGFVVSGVRADGTYGTMKIAKSLGKPFLIIEDKKSD
jgi:predicted Rossmann-fold nucleotide-binding protein